MGIRIKVSCQLTQAFTDHRTLAWLGLEDTGGFLGNISLLATIYTGTKPVKHTPSLASNLLHSQYLHI